MLNVLRENLKHLKWLLWVVAISMTLYLGAYFFEGGSGRGGVGADWAARVGGDPIPTTQFIDAARRMDEYYRQLMGDRYEEIRPQLRLGEQVVQALVDEKIKLKEARKLGLTASPEEIARHIQEDPNLRDETGQFIGKERYTQFVQRNWLGGIEDFERIIAETITIQKWSRLVTEPVGIGDLELEEAYRARNEKTTIDYAVVAASDQKIDTKTGEAELRAWYESHTEQYRRGEARRIRFVLVDRQAQIPKLQIGEDDLRAHYESNRAQFSHPEQRRARHILFRVPPEATEAERAVVRRKAEQTLEALRSGGDFDALARVTSEDTASARAGGDLGFFGRGAMVGPFEEAAFGTEVGQFAPLTETQFGIHVIQVTGARPAGETPFEEVREQIRRQLELRRAHERVTSEAQRLRAAIGSAEDLDAVAAREGLEVQTRLLTREDRQSDLGASPEFMDAVFGLSPGEVSAPLPVARGIAIVTVAETSPPAVARFEEVRERVMADLLNDRARRAAVASARTALARARDLDDAARSLGVEVKRGNPAAPGQALAGTGGSATDLDRVLRDPELATGATGVVAVPAGALLYRVTEVQRFDPAVFAARKESFRQEMLNQKRSVFLQSLIATLRGKHEIEINQPLVEQVGR